MGEQKKRNAVKDLVSGLALVLFGIYVIIESKNMRVYNTFIDAPGFFPMIIGFVMAGLGAVLAYIGYKSGGIGELKEVCTASFLKKFLMEDATVRVLILLAMMIVYIYVLVGRLHFILASAIYLMANFLYLNAVKKWWVAAIIAVVTSVVAYYAFRLGFGIILP